MHVMELLACEPYVLFLFQNVTKSFDDGPIAANMHVTRFLTKHGSRTYICLMNVDYHTWFIL
jgi:hypothetical protein